MNDEQKRLVAARLEGAPWRKWGPYLSERQWGTVREDYGSERRRLEPSQSRPRPLARLPVGRGRPRRDLGRPPDPLLRAGAVEREGSDSQGAPLRPHQQRGESRRGRQGVLLLPRQHADPFVHAVPLQVPAARRFRTSISSRPTAGAPATSSSTSSSTPACSPTTGTSTSTSSTRRRHPRTCSSRSRSSTAVPSRPRFTSCRRSGFGTPGPGRATERRAPGRSTRAPGQRPDHRRAQPGRWASTGSSARAGAELLFVDNETNPARSDAGVATAPDRGTLLQGRHQRRAREPAAGGRSIRSRRGPRPPRTTSSTILPAGTAPALRLVWPRRHGGRLGSTTDVGARQPVRRDASPPAATRPTRSTPTSFPARCRTTAGGWCARRWPACSGASSSTTTTSTAGWPITAAIALGRRRRLPQRRLAPPGQRGRHLDAGQVGVPLVRGLGPGVPLDPARPRRSGLRQAAAAAVAAGALPAPERTGARPTSGTSATSIRRCTPGPRTSSTSRRSSARARAI